MPFGSADKERKTFIVNHTKLDVDFVKKYKKQLIGKMAYTKSTMGKTVPHGIIKGFEEDNRVAILAVMGQKQRLPIDGLYLLEGIYLSVQKEELPEEDPDETSFTGEGPLAPTGN